MKIGSLLKRERNEKDWSYEELSLEVYVRYEKEISARQIRRVEQEASSPTLRTINLLFGALWGVSADELNSFIVELLEKGVKNESD
jgi:transcriptional regulator with XRE-family HTH domain